MKNNTSTAIEIKNVSKKYLKKPKILKNKILGIHEDRNSANSSGFEALKNISIEIQKGESFGIIGKNGSGKSTLLQLLAKISTASSGSIEVNGRVVALLELGSGFSNDFTGLENIYMNASLHGLKKIEIENRLESIINFSEIGEFIDQPVSSYSTGMVLRLAFSIIAHVDAEIMLIDEAFAVGDFSFMQKCNRFLSNFCKIGTLILVTHDLASLQSICSRALWLDSGKIRMVGKVKDVSNEYLSEVMKQNDIQHSIANEEDFLKEDQIKTPFSFGEILISRGNAEEEIFSNNQMKITEYKCKAKSNNQRISIEIDTKVLISEINVNPLLGFNLCNEKGLMVIGECNPIEYKNSFNNDTDIMVRTSIICPLLRSGLYSLSIAIANGTITNHKNHHLINDAFIVEIQNKKVNFGLVKTSVTNNFITL